MRKLIPLLLVVTLSFTACKVGRFVIYNFANITDYKKFPKRELEKSDQPFQFARRAKERAPRSLTIDGEKVAFDKYIEDNKTVAFLIIKNDTIQYERYFNNYERESIIASFSMAKSFTSILIGFAIQENLIGSVEDSVTKYVPELKENGFDKVSIKHLLQMTSGMKFNESYSNPFGHAATYYYGRNLKRALFKMKLEQVPGTEFNYQSGSTQLLGLILKRVLKEQSITSYMQEKLWQPLGMEYDGSWSLDKKKDGLEKTFCCLNARALDFAKFGRFFLREGNWNGKQLLNKEWVKNSTKLDDSEGATLGYQYQWWKPGNDESFMAEGILGQYVYVEPSKNLIIVRMGKNYGKASWTAILKSLARAY